jgi:rifampicin phosphotransferase
MAKIWVVDDELSQKYPIYTRGNVGEVFPEAVAPLSWTLAGRAGAEPGWRDAFERFGAFDRDEFNPDEMEILGVFGGYCYLNVSVSRVFAVRVPGLTPELMDLTIFGTSEAPPYRPLPTDESPVHTERINQTLGWVFTVDELPELVDHQRLVQNIINSRPDLSSLSDQELLDHARSSMDHFRELFAEHLFITYCSTVPVGALNQIAAQLGDPGLAMRLVAGVGGVDSAAPSWALWELARQVAASPALMAQFDKGVEGLEDRLESSEEAAKFLQEFQNFKDEFGSRGPNEWEMRSPTWGTHPELALAAIDRMRKASEDSRPQRHFDERAEEREALTAQVAEQLAGTPDVQAQFLGAVRAGGLFLAGRERSKTTIIKLVHEARLAFHELGRRMVAAGHFDHVEDFGMLTNDEWDSVLDDPVKFKAVIRERTKLYDRLQELEPPFILDGEVIPIERWPKKRSTPVAVATSGDTLAGIAGCPGQYTGTARVILSPNDPGELEPGDVLIAPITDPSWTPLFVPAGAVIVDVGAQISHAVIVSRELGIPCVVSVTDATRRIPDGARVTVDGTAGTVTVL